MDSELVCLHEDDRETGLQISNNLNFNVEQGSCSPKVPDISAGQSDLSSKDEASMDGILKFGMEFESDEHAHKFYNKYAGLVGFNVRKDWVNRSKVHGQVVSRKFTCSREGYRRKDKRDTKVKKRRKETRTGCLAHMVVTRQHNGKYQITHFEVNHNHDSVNTPTAQQLLELQSEFVDGTEAIEVVSANKEIQSDMAFQLLGRPFGAPYNLDYLAMDCTNCLKSARTRDMKEGEAGHLLYYFHRQHFENPSFFYVVQLDIDDKVSNIYWADDNMVVDYDHFGDVVCLDTVYRTSKNFWPLVQFIGLNNHKQVVVFGAALLYDDTVDSFKWLFQTFIESMSGKKPKAILTDQDATIIEAIASVLPDTEHRVCVWQMYVNAVKHLIPAIKVADSFVKDFRSCIFDHEDDEDFIHAWGAMLEKFSLQQNDWLRWMFREKEKWAVAYGRNTFFIDGNGTHLVENLYDYLKDCLNPDVDVLKFFHCFENLVNEQRYKELQANYNMERCTPGLMGNVILLKHASEIYTPRAFEVFQREYEKSLNVVVNQCGENGSLFEYKANKYGKSQEYSVTFNSLDTVVSCSCMKFEYVGFICCHGLKVLDHQNIKVVPSCFILKRWTKDARIENVSQTSICSQAENTKLTTASRYRNLCHNIHKISSKAAESGQAFEFALRQLDEVMQGVEKLLAIKPSNGARVITSSSAGANATESEPADIFLDKTALDSQDVDNILRGTTEIESNIREKDQLNDLSETISNLNRLQSPQSSQPDTVTSRSCQPPPYISTSTPPPSSIQKGFYSFEANQVVQCIYQTPNLAMDPQANHNMYHLPNFYSNPHDSPNQAQFLQESLLPGPFQDSIANNAQLKQAIDLDVQNPHSSLFRLGNKRS